MRNLLFCVAFAVVSATTMLHVSPAGDFIKERTPAEHFIANVGNSSEFNALPKVLRDSLSRDLRDPFKMCKSSPGDKLMTQDEALQTYRTNSTQLAGKRIAIVGGGVGGLVAAVQLQRSGADVMVFEMHSEPGGRVKTHCFDDGSCVELGAMRLLDSHKIVRGVAAENNVTVAPFHSSPGREIVDIMGNQFELNDFHTRADILSKLSVHIRPEWLNKTADSVLTELFEPLEVFRRKYPEFSHRLDLCTSELVASQFLYAAVEKPMTSEELWYLTFEANYRCYINTVSLYDQLVDASHFSTNPKYETIKPNMQSLAYNMIANNNISVAYNTQIKAIRQHENRVFLCGKETDDTNDSLSCNWYDGVLITTTAPAASAIQFEPPLPFMTKTAMDTIHYDQAVKIALSFHSDFCTQVNASKVITDGLSRILYFLEPCIVLSYTWAEDAERLAYLSEHDRQLTVLMDLSRMFGKELVDRYYNKVYVTIDWKSREGFGGAFALYSANNAVDVHCGLIGNEWTIDGRKSLVRFSGEHKEPQGHAWIEYSMLSAIKVADALTKAILSREIADSSG